ncbi:MAG TPA: deoxyribodipyrimidine photo-lyase, partial [Bacteroidales bacterium]|nr:deoxyribodipyrimidine photo-lyase [Bacteroidales bacterium]
MEHNTSQDKVEKIVIFWFRRDLRIDDNAGFYQALSSGYPVMPVFIVDTNILEQVDTSGDARVLFIRSALSALNQNMIPAGSCLQVFRGNPVKVFAMLSEKLNIHAVYTNTDYEPYSMQRDSEVAAVLKSKGTAFKTFKDQVLYDTTEIVKSDNTPYTVFTPYSRVWKKRLLQEGIPSYKSEKLLGHLLKHQPAGFPVDTIYDINGTIPLPKVVIPSAIIRGYHNTRDYPALAGTTRLGHHLRFGTVSLRKLAAAAAINETWLNELIWREFFMMILWHYPKVLTESFKKKYDGITWRNNEQEFERWCRGETGFPIVDAGMRELNATGWMHNRVRMITAGFLVKHLLIDWRWGETYFAQKLIDYELAANNGNWQWA